MDACTQICGTMAGMAGWDAVSCGIYIYKDLYFTSFLYGLYACMIFSFPCSPHDSNTLPLL